MKTQGWSEPDKDGSVKFTQIGGCCMSSVPPKREGFEVRFVACVSGRDVTWTFAPVKVPV